MTQATDRESCADRPVGCRNRPAAPSGSGTIPPHPYRNLGDLVLATAGAFGDDVAFQVRRGFRTERITFGQVGHRARQVAAWLGARGLRPGDRLAIWSPNMPEYAVLCFGAWLAGVVVVPIDVRTSQEAVDRFVAAAEPTLGFRSRLLPITFGAPVAETIALEDLFDLVASAPMDLPVPEIDAGSLAEIAFTSGTTGVPKGVMLTHGNFLAEIAALRAVFPLKRSYRALSLLPLSHIYEQVVNLLLAFSFGVRMTYVTRVNAATISAAMREGEITCLAIVPQLLRLLLAGMERRVREGGQWRRWQAAHRLAEQLPFRLRRLLFAQAHRALGGHLQFFASGGAPLDASLAAAWERMGIRVFEGYGLTETTAAAALNTWTAQRLGTVGRPLPGLDVRIAPDGEVQMRGPVVSPGYFGRPDLDAESFTADGWFRSGDVGHFDADGFLHLSGRKVFKIVLADGRNVYPEDIERALNDHPLVRESVVVGARRGDRGERVHAVLLTDRPDQLDRIVRETNAGLEPQQQIREASVWPEPDLPRTPTLKVNRHLVLATVEGQAAPAAASQPSGAETTLDPLVGVVARVSECPAEQVRDAAELELDLGLDSIGRIELIAALEDELGIQVDELAVTPQTTVGALRTLARRSGPPAADVRPARWHRSPWAQILRRGLLWAAFRLQDRWMDIEVVHPERAARIPFPSILIFNYQGPYVPLLMLRAMPPALRRKVAIAMEARYWEEEGWKASLAALGAQAFPFQKSGAGPVRPSLEEMGRWLDDGYAVIISPEGQPEEDGQLLPFLHGAGLMTVEMGVPVVPFRVEDYWRLFPKDLAFPFLPERQGRVRLIVGEPIVLPPGTSYQEATRRMHEAVRDLR